MRMDPRNLTHYDGELYAWFIFNLHTEVSFIFTGYLTRYLQIYNNSQENKNPCFNKVTPYYLQCPPKVLVGLTQIQLKEQ
jgi:hypothetical protein